MNMAPEKRIRSALTKFRNVIVLARFLNALSRALVAAMMLFCILLLAGRVIPLPDPLVVGPAIFLAAVLLYSLRTRNSMALLPCALTVDRMFDLDERLSTAAETLSAGRGDEMSSAQLQDADSTALKVRCRSIFAKLTAGLARRLLTSAGLALFALSTLYIPSLGNAEDEGNDLLARVTVAEASSIKSFLDRTRQPENQSPAAKALLSQLQTLIDSALKGETGATEFSAGLERIRGEIDALLASKELTAQERALLETLAKQTGNGYAAVAAALRRQGIETSSPLSAETLRKIERLRPKMEGRTEQALPSEKPLADIFHPSQTGSAPSPSDTQIRIVETVTKAMGSPDWPKQYDQAIRRYYSGDRQ